MKKIIAIVLSLIIVLSCSVMAAADDKVGDRTTTAAPTGEYSCSICGAYFKTSEALVNHMTTYHNSNTATTAADKGYVCGICNTSFATQDALVQHMNTYHSLKCPYCGNVFTSQETYNAHLPVCKENHPTQIDPADISVNSVIQALQDFFGLLNGNFDTYLWTDIQNVLIQLIEFANNLMNNMFMYGLVGNNTPAQNDVMGAIDDLEAKTSLLGLPDAKFAEFEGIISQLKSKIKAIYANSESAQIEETVAEAPVDTGSSTAAIVAFCAVSCAAAAAYVCVKKKS